MNFPIDRVSIREILIDELKKQFGDNQAIYQNGLLGYWINSLSILAENDLFYTLSALNESFLSRAIQPSSIVEHSKSLGYKINLASPSSGYVQIYIPLNEFKRFKVETNINQLKFISPKGIMYICPYAVQLFIDIDKGINNCYIIDSIGNRKNITTFLNNVILPDTGEVFCVYFSLPVIQSNLITKIYTISDQDTKVGKNPIIEVPLDLKEGESIGDINVYVNGIKYTQFSFLFEMNSSDLGYVVEYDLNNISIILGNNVFGYRPKTGSTVLIEVNLTFGALGNVEQNTLVLDTPLVDVLSNKKLKVYINHLEIMNGLSGDDYNEIRVNTIRSLRNGSIYDEINKKFHRRLVTYHDFIDVINLSFKDVFDGISPIVKKSDSFSNNIILYLTPKIKDPINGNRPLKCTSGVVGPLQIDTTTVLFSQNQKISNSNFADVVFSEKGGGYSLKEYVSLFEVVFIRELSGLSYVKYNYIMTDLNIPLNVISQSKHIGDYFTEVKANYLNIKYENNKFLFQLDLHFYTNEEITEVEDTGINLFENYSMLPDFNLSDIIRPSVSLKNLKTLELILIDSNSWKIRSIVKDKEKYTISIVYIIDSLNLKENNYQINVDCLVKVNDIEENIFKAYITNVYFKYDFTNLFPLTYEVDDNYIYIYNLPLIDASDFFENQLYLNQVFIPSLIELKKEIDVSKMLTSDISIAFTKTTGFIKNIKYNKNNFSSVYTYSDSYINFIELPLKYIINVIPSKNVEDINSFIQQIKDSVFNFLQTKRGVHSSIFPSELIDHILSVGNIYDVSVDLNGFPEGSNIPLNFDFDEQTDIPSSEIRSYVPEYIWLNSKDDIIVQIKKTKEIV